MKTLNLTNLEASDIKYRVLPFPDGQQQVVILGAMVLEDMGDINPPKWFGPYLNKVGKKITIKARLNNFKDLEVIVCATKSLRKLGVKEIHLYTPYFLGSRSDRQFEEGSNNYLKDVICPIINGLNFDSITVLDPHSDVLEACLNNFKKIDNKKLIAMSFCSIYKSETVNMDKCVLVSPDAGASKKIYKLAEQIGYKGDIITCSKDRDVDGKLTKTIVPYVFCKGENNPYNEKVYGKDIIIIDDICDGGATFINIAKEIKNALPDIAWFKQYNHPIPKIYLIITHGIFSKGFEELSQYFDAIYCTNSYKDITFPHSMKGYLNRNSQQLNVF
jgi:ribose-phosphate pyrophosphokinase